MARSCRLTSDMPFWLYYLENAELLGWPSEEIDLERRLGEAQSKDIWMVEDRLRDEVVDSDPDKKLLIVEALINGYLDNDRARDAYFLAHAWTLDYPDDWLPWLYLGRSNQLGLSLDKAIAAYKRVLELKPDQPQARLWLAQTFLIDREFDQALQHYQTYLQRNRGNTDALLGLAKCQFSMGQLDAARESLIDLLQQHQDNVLGLLAMAQMEQSEAPEKALPWLRRAAALSPNDPNILYNLAVTLRAVHKDQEAEGYNQRLKDRLPKLNRLFELQTQLIKDANNIELRFQIAVLNLELGNEEEAAHWFQTVLWIDPNHRPTLRALADYWRKLGDSRRTAYYAGRAEGAIPHRLIP